MLESFKGSCRFLQYTPSKPAKYGIKLFFLVDAMTFYTNKLEICGGKQREGPYFQDTSTNALVKRMIEPISGTGQNVTMDNWFTSVPLTEQLLTDHDLTVLGTMRKNKPEILNEFRRKGLEVYSTVFGYKQKETLLSYCPKKDKTVLLLSTMHNDGVIDKTSEKNFQKSLSFIIKRKEE
ncbi:PiggyBac transposable element-derived protein 4 [Eumeta japonica]|uniref:PiggyBac transposable element-derived protein 4 n=1 Tax=Eumeta variegata TaxID=151549 RepID=A0A4C1XMR4_EUMVA|nr:PiggyBac transposable element-derived protein 4 [Eumeta japonica]